MNEMKVFVNSEFGELQVVMINDKPYFPATECAKVLGYSNPTKAINDHCPHLTKREVGVQTGIKADGTPAMQTIEKNFIPEGDLYRLIARSQLPAAEKFERWVFDEVLPSIRRSGGYIAGQEEMSADELMAKALLVAQRTLAEREARISQLVVDKQIMAPKADYFDALVERNLLTSLRDTAKQFGVKEREFIGFLTDKKYLYRDQKGKLTPFAGKGDGLFEVKECFNDKTNWSGVQTMVTPKGRETFRLLIGG